VQYCQWVVVLGGCSARLGGERGRYSKGGKYFYFYFYSYL